MAEEPTPVAVCEICGKPVTPDQDARITESHVVHVACAMAAAA